MKNKAVRYLVLAILSVVWFVPPPLAVKAQDAASVFMEYTNPHAVCDYYRSQGVTVVRESDNECLTSLGEGRYTVYTQYYYSGDQWCYQLTQEGATQFSNCVPIPSDSPADAISEFFSDFRFDAEHAPYIITGGIVIVLIVTVIVAQSVAHARSAEKTFNPKVKRSGKGSYGWEEMETTTTEELNAKPPAGPGDAQPQGGVGLHQGEPIQPPAPSTASELEKLLKLKEKGALTQKEFDLAKKKLLG